MRLQTLTCFREILQFGKVFEKGQFEMDLEGGTLPFKANNCVIEQPINLDKSLHGNSPFVLTVPKSTSEVTKFTLGFVWLSSGRREESSKTGSMRRCVWHRKGVLGV